MATRIVSYNAGSGSYKALSEALGIKRLKEQGSTWRGKRGDVLINWGRGLVHHPAFDGNAIIINKPSAVERAANKLGAFRAFREAEVRTPEWTTVARQAREWIQGVGVSIVARTKLTGHSGEGIVIVEAENIHELPAAPLYTQYVKKTQEYRLHVHKDEVFFVQRKARKREVPDERVNWQVRNHQNGFIYAHQDVQVPDGHKELAVKAVKALRLDFGAVDLIETKRGEALVLEVNTACGLEGATLQAYKDQFQQYI